MNSWQRLIKQDRAILADGAMGTMLFAAGLEFGDPPELWNERYPERIRAVHRDYLAAGAQLILTNTFGGNRFRLAFHNLQSRVVELNRAAVRLACAEVEAAGGQALVAGDIGPSGEILAPLGELAYEEAVAGFAEQATALVAAGVDLIWIETMSALEEVQAAMEGVRRVSADIPIITTMTFDTRGHTMMGVKPETAVKTLAGWGAAAVGGNCGNGPDEIIGVIEKMHAVAPHAILVAKSNVGLPVWLDGRAVYQAGPQVMADYAAAVREAGARIIGGCCGSTPAHLQAMAERVMGNW
ncbi:MAG: betaine--homocysteine S-methyltransferase [Chloroflexota bacterium]